MSTLNQNLVQPVLQKMPTIGATVEKSNSENAPNSLNNSGYKADRTLETDNNDGFGALFYEEGNRPQRLSNHSDKEMFVNAKYNTFT